MQDSLYEFLLLNKKISLPGIGTISLCQAPAQHDFPNKQFIAPSFFFTIDPKNDKPSKKLFDWLSSSLNITEWEAIKSINDFSFDLKKKLSEFGEVNWQKIGVLRRHDIGALKLEPQNVSLQSEPAVAAEKVIRVKAEHTILVGEKEKTSVEMEEYLAAIPAKKNYTWLIAVILTVLAVMFIGWYFSEKGFSTSSAGNQSVIKTN
jgi:hypothetical protein